MAPPVKIQPLRLIYTNICWLTFYYGYLEFTELAESFLEKKSQTLGIQ